MFEAACRVPDYTSAETYAKELLIMHHASNDTISEGLVSLALGKIYQSLKEFEMASRYYQHAIDMMRSTGDKQAEAEC